MESFHPALGSGEPFGMRGPMSENRCEPGARGVAQHAATTMLQDDLRRAKIEPWAWVINKSAAATGTTDPLLQARLVGERRQAARIAGGLARRTFVLPWLAEPPVGVSALGALAAPFALTAATPHL